MSMSFLKGLQCGLKSLLSRNKKTCNPSSEEPVAPPVQSSQPIRGEKTVSVLESVLEAVTDAKSKVATKQKGSRHKPIPSKVEIPNRHFMKSELRKQIDSEPPAERMRHFAKLYGGSFSLDASDLEYLADAPLNVDLRTYLHEKYDLAFDLIKEGDRLEGIKSYLDRLEEECNAALKNDKSEIDYDLKMLLKKIDEFRIENRIEISEEANEEKGDISTIAQLELWYAKKDTQSV